uniref:Serine--tRNA ligase n=2 Tax=environmental samples TaxID=651140 RepID=A0A075GXQ3_9ARCH|nr:seryl-tRNA synthetase (SARS, serS) [uncultured marine thaumarchaeote KM3_31_E07]AIF08609.1 seryl-tRNA synthetase (SARS, serS) [uncultured marine thaumarchaeote KM3_31_F07]|tara:strand:- start:2182 stop:3450 length:1269 start_codon:yes stop_codon:yes gene_type:complete
MLDGKLIRDHTEIIKATLVKRYIEFPLDELLDFDKKRRILITEAQELKHERNLVSEKIVIKKKQDQDVSEIIKEMKIITDRISALDTEIDHAEKRYKELMLSLPNLIHESVPEGKNENDNIEIKKWGEPKKFGFNIKDHIDITTSLNLIDVERAAKTSGARFYFLKGNLVKMNHALIQFAFDFLIKKGYTLLQTPYMINKKSMEGAVIVSDFGDVIYKIEDDDLYLIGTSEHAIVAMHMNEIFNIKELPIKYAGISPCFRKEAGAHGRDTKGIFRAHQFEKVEQLVFVKPEESWVIHEEMLKNTEEFFQLLDIPYRVMLLCSAELGKVSAKTYDIEAWMPGQNAYREIVSCSNCLDYQARRLGIKYREKPNEESKFVHTLNSTLVATERTLVAIIENYQTENGSVIIPNILKPYMNNIEELK